MPLKVYYLDDEVELLEIVREIFSDEEIEISTFSSVEQLITATAKDPPDLFLLDFRLPATTGVEVAKRLPPGIPKALITGELEVEPSREFIAFFSKPFEVDEIRRFFIRQNSGNRY